MTRRQLKVADARIYRIAGERVSVGITDIRKLFAAGREAIEAGADDEQLAKALEDFLTKNLGK